jgi:hypothetical protein
MLAGAMRGSGRRHRYADEARAIRGKADKAPRVTCASLFLARFSGRDFCISAK